MEFYLDKPELLTNNYNIIRILDLFNSKYYCKICRKKLRCKADEIIHLKIIHIRNKKELCNKDFKCPFCEKEENTYFRLKIHLMVDHLNEKPYRCRICKKTFYDFFQLKQHIRKRHLKKDFYSNKFFNLIEYENSIFKNNHHFIFMKKFNFKEFILKPIYNNTKFELLGFKNNSKKITRILKVKVKLNLKKCFKCSKFYKSKHLCNICKEHMIFDDKLSQISNCWKCRFKYKLHPNLIKYINLEHFNEKHFECDVCVPVHNISFTDFNEIKLHFKQKHKKKLDRFFFIFICVICKRTYQNYEQIIRHFIKNIKCYLLSSNTQINCCKCDKSNDKLTYETHISQNNTKLKFEEKNHNSNNQISNIKNSINNKKYSVEYIINSNSKRSMITNSSRVDDIAAKIISMKQQKLLNLNQKNCETNDSNLRNNFNFELNSRCRINDSGFFIPDSFFHEVNNSTFFRNSNINVNEIGVNKNLYSNNYSILPLQTILYQYFLPSFIFKCEFCGYSFKSEFELNSHKIMHSSSNLKRPFKCHLCLVTFAKTEQLIRHMIVHQANEADYICQICFSTFTRKQDLDRHMSFHSR